MKKSTGVMSIGVKTPIIQKGDNLIDIAMTSIKENGLTLENNDIITITEAVVAIAQGNFVTKDNIVKDVKNKFNRAKSIAIVDPIQSRNRFLQILKSIASVEELEEIYIFLRYPTDEVGNRLVTDEILMEKKINPYTDIMTGEEFCKKVGEPMHKFTKINYIKEYEKACNGKAKVIMCNDFSKVPNYCKDALVCNIHNKEMIKNIIKTNGGETVLDMSEIMNEPINGSGYNEKYGLYGSNLMAGNRLKLMPRDCQELVENLQKEIEKLYNVHIEAMVFGDGAFKDPVGGIWELADPTTTIGATNGLLGTPKEVKLKFISSQYDSEQLSSEELEKIVAMEKEKRKENGATNNNSLGTTPRQITDLVASLSDLTTGSGDRQTPVVLIKNYLG